MLSLGLIMVDPLRTWCHSLFAPHLFQSVSLSEEALVTWTLRWMSWACFTGKAIQLVPLRGEEAAMYLSGNRSKIQSAPGISDHLPFWTKIPSFDSKSLPSLLVGEGCSVAPRPTSARTCVPGSPGSWTRGDSARVRSNQMGWNAPSGSKVSNS